MSNDAVPITLINWLATYLLHSTILLGAAWVLSGVLSQRFDALKEMAWKFALVGGVLSASAHVAQPNGGFGHFLMLPDQITIHSSTGSPEEAAGLPGNVDPSTAQFPGGREASPDAVAGSNTINAVPPRAGRDAWAGESGIVADWIRRIRLFSQDRAPMLGAAAPWIAMSIVGVSTALLILAFARLRGALRGRRRVADQDMLEVFRTLCESAGVRHRVRLTTSPRITSPLAIGLWRAEICLPARAAELGEAELEAMLAHELAHVVRRDPLWMTIGHGFSLLLFVQPLNRLAHRRLRDLAEFQCDAWAALQCRDGLSLARCLTEVASWMVHPGPCVVPALTAGMSVRQSTLSRRVGRLLEHDPTLERSWRHRMLTILVMGLMAMTVALTPSVAAVRSVASDVVASAPAPELRDSNPPMALPVATPDTISPAEDDARDPWIALELELIQMEREVAKIRAAVANTPLSAEFADLLDQFERKGASIRARSGKLRDAASQPDPNAVPDGRRGSPR